MKPGESAAVQQAAGRAAVMIREAAASVALSHPHDCRCTVCRAVDGDLSAMGEIMRAVEDDR
jgi:hypothetical protein